MADTQKKTKAHVTKSQKKEKAPLIPAKYQDAAYIIGIFLLVYIFFSSAIFGGGFNASDNIASKSFDPYVQKAEASGEFPQWIPYIFSGMPSYAALLTTGTRIWDFIPTVFFGMVSFVGDIFSSDVARVIFYYFLYGLGMYLLMRSKKHERYVAFFTAIAAIFSTYVITWVMIGHNTKPVVFAMFPYIFLLLEQLRSKFSLLLAVLLVLAVHIMMQGSHLQLIFYGVIAFAIYLIFEFLERAVKKEGPVKVLRAGALLVIAGGIAFLMSADRYFSTLEYTPYSTRGSGPIVKSENSRDAGGGNDYDYATMWSFSPDEMLTFLVPSYFGFGLREYKGEMQPLYWGQKESEDSPPYMGIGVLALAALGFALYRKDPFIQTMFALSLFSLFLSFGKNNSFVYDLFYYHVPYFNKFRAPSMALALIQFAVPIMAGYGLTGILKLRKEAKPSGKKVMNIAIFISGLFLLAGIIFAAFMKNSYLNTAANSIAEKFRTTPSAIPPDLSDFIWSATVNDWIVGGFIVVAFMFFGYLFVTKKINKGILFTVTAVLLVIDLWRVDFRRMDVSEQTIEQDVFAPYAPVYNAIKKDKSLYRIADFSAPQQNIPAYFLLQNVNGYHSAKLRVYQDILDVANAKGYEGNTSYLNNQFLWSMLNVKYIVAKNPKNNNRPHIIQNEKYLPRAFFVNKAEKADGMAILTHLKNGDFDPRGTAYFDKDIPSNVEPAGDGATAEVKEYKDQYIKIDVNATGNNLLFIGEVYYPPAWKALIDGKEAEIYKTNYAFRSVLVPKGHHTLEMVYRSEGFENGKTLSLISNIVVIIAGAFGGFLLWKKKKQAA